MYTQVNVIPIRISLSLSADGSVPRGVDATLGRVTVGPKGFLSVLESRLGIPPSDVSFSTRLIQYLACVDAADNGGAFYSTSYGADPFSVACTLLQWRDQWYLAGWNGSFDAEAPGRLADMATIEHYARESVDPCVGQRVQRVISLLPNNPVAVESIELLDPFVDFPFLWRSLIEAVDVPVREAADLTPQGREGTDLRKLQERLLANTSKKTELSGDGTIMALRGATAQDSTAFTATFVHRHLVQSPEKSLGLLAEKRGDLVDEAMEAIGVPRLGFNVLSTWRPVFQVLPLACELLWEPLSPTALFQFLSHSVGPIPARQREVLADTVARVPGIGSAKWKKAVSECLEKEDEKDRQRYEEEILYWLESPRHDPRTGVDCATLSGRARRIADWLTGAREASDSTATQSLYTIALRQTLEFVKAVERLEEHGRELLTRDNVLRLIEDVRGAGAPVADRQAEVCPGQSRALPAIHAGAFHTPLDTVIWWDCQACDRVHRWPWSRTERTALADHGVMLQSEDEHLEWLGKAWLRPVLNARELCMLVLHDDVDRHHPVWDQIVSLTEGLPVLSATDDDSIERLGMPRKPLEPRSLPRKNRWWSLPDEIRIPTREFESYSSLDNYIHSPYQWLLRYAARIRPGSLATVSDGPILKGNLAHRLYEEFFNGHPEIQDIDLERIPEWTDDHLPALLTEEGALLLEPGRQAECERFITVVKDSLKTLVDHLLQAGVVQVDTEIWQEGHFTGGRLNGFIDLLATTAEGREAVVDIKWGGNRYRRESLIQGSYLQLATYAQLRLAAGASSCPELSYYIVLDTHMLSLDHGFFPEAERIVPDTQENPARFWQRFEHTWRWRKSQFNQGLVEVTIAGTEPTADSQPGEEGLLLPDASDSFNDYRVLTGWEDDA
ncbi:MAG: PD-(D/E)XK nuclease family protein [Pseudomonadota bacterium]|nr:PD-(D/E)XK nuclease family protein [Pseudomonadota bacterium]